MKKVVKNLLPICLVVALVMGNLSVIASAALETKTQQETTAYVSTGSKTASGLWPQIGYAAVHPRWPGAQIPIINFGTILYVTKIVNKYPPYEEWDAIYHPTAGELSTLIVQDMGDTDYGVHPNSEYWVDIFWGVDLESARQFGTRYMDYSYYN